MYIFELITRYISGKRYKTRDYNPVSENITGLAEIDSECEHFFLPLDSSNEMFACKYCGYVVSKDKLKIK